MKAFLLSILLPLTFALSGQTVKNVDAETFQKLLAGGKGELIDLRTDDEIDRKGMIPGAKQIDFLAKDSEEQIKKLDKNKTYLIYCAGGGRSAQCAELMEANGFKSVVNLSKGYDDWKKKGFATVTREKRAPR